MNKKHIPKRTCVICRIKTPKKDLFRLVKTPNGRLMFDPSGNMDGRGAYICGKQSHWLQTNSKNSVERSLVTKLDDYNWKKILLEIEILKKDGPVK